jgi:hypothetical protein
MAILSFVGPLFEGMTLSMSGRVSGNPAVVALRRGPFGPAYTFVLFPSPLQLYLSAAFFRQSTFTKDYKCPTTPTTITLTPRSILRFVRSASAILRFGVRLLMLLPLALIVAPTTSKPRLKRL